MRIPKGSFLFHIFLIILLAFSWWMVFSGLPIRIWDEAVYATDAIAMAETGDLFKLANNEKVLFYNTKPPLAIWLQAASIKMFGVSEFSVRLPSLLAYLTVIISLFVFLYRLFNNYLLPIASILVLITSVGFLTHHVALTGDLDMILTMWCTLLALQFYDVSVHGPRAKKMYIIGLLIVLAFLTKSVSIFLPLPGLALCMLASARGREIFTNKHIYIAALGFVILVAGYYLLINSLIPGYFNHVWDSEFGRYLETVMSWHEQDYDFYFKNLGIRFYPWIFILPIGILLGLISKDPSVRRLTRFSSIYVFAFMLIISVPKVKLEWYEASAYPFMSLLVGIFFFEVYRRLSSQIPVITGKLLSLVLLLALSLPAAIKVYQWNFSWQDPLEREGDALRSLYVQNKNIPLKVFMPVDHDAHLFQLDFYRQQFSKEKDINIELYKDADQTRKGDTLLICQTEKLLQFPPYEVIGHVKNCKIIVVK